MATTSRGAPLTELAERLTSSFQEAARSALGQELPDLHFSEPAQSAHGDWAVASCLPLARVLGKSPRDIAKSLVAELGPIEGIAKLEIAGPGYINIFFDRKAIALALLARLESDPPPAHDVLDRTVRAAESKVDRQAHREKVIVEHTNINPNKAAHIGHLRNAVLGDSLVRLLQHSGAHVEVQNYIDDTGVQVGDVVVAFTSMEGRSPEAALVHVESLIEAGARPFDHLCWDAYAAVGRWYAEDAARLQHRRDALHAMERGEGPMARLGERIAMTVVERHLMTMDRIGVRYHVLPRESDVLAMKFWHVAFERLKDAKAIHFATEGKNAGCWVMPLTETEEFKNLEDPDKVIVRGDGTVTYVGKDIAYQMWKLGLLESDFRYRPFHAYQPPPPRTETPIVWVTDSTSGSADDHPEFGQGRHVYNVIDVRQSYLQQIVRNALLLTGHADEAARSIHFSYEMVALTPATAAKLGFELTEDEKKAPFVEMSGRRGLGVKADDVLDVLESSVLARVVQADLDLAREGSPESQRAIARDVAAGALRYFMARITRNRVIAFDIEEALQLQGETGPYLQYSLVRVASIFRKLGGEAVADAATLAGDDFDMLRDGPVWEVVLQAARIPDVLARATASLELSIVARHAFVLSQAFSTFYRDNSLLHAETDTLRRQRAAVARIFLLAQRQLLSILGVPEPERM